MEMLSIKRELEESAKARMTRFLNGLNQDTKMWWNSNNMKIWVIFFIKMKLERQLKRRLAYQKYASWSSSKDKKEEERSLQLKSSKHSSSFSKEHKNSSSFSRDPKILLPPRIMTLPLHHLNPNLREKKSSMKC